MAFWLVGTSGAIEMVGFMRDTVEAGFVRHDGLLVMLLVLVLVLL